MEKKKALVHLKLWSHQGSCSSGDSGLQVKVSDVFLNTTELIVNLN